MKGDRRAARGRAYARYLRLSRTAKNIWPKYRGFHGTQVSALVRMIGLSRSVSAATLRGRQYQTNVSR
jgi:hypothetical protein